jgi:ribonuclease-3
VEKERGAFAEDPRPENLPASADGRWLADSFEALAGYRFIDIALLMTALTLPSWRTDAKTGANNQRLEFLGDAVLGLLAAEHLYAAHTDADEGGLSLLRIQIANGRTLADVARRMGLSGLMRVGKSEERSGGRDREGALADTLEALLGALWLDGGCEAARAFFLRFLAGPFDADPIRGVLHAGNPKGRLQERTQACDGSIPLYTLVATVGPEHQPQYRVRVSLSTGFTAEAEGASKRVAEAAAAQVALDALDAGETRLPPTAPAVGK